MTIIYISDFDLRGSGYMNIAVSLCAQLSTRGLDVIALGLGYKGQEHNHPFRIVPAQLNQLIPMVKQLQTVIDVEAVVVALDIPLQERLLEQLEAPCEIPYVGLFPLESDPLCSSWALTLLRMDARLIMSHFGHKELDKEGVDSLFIPIGIDSDSWRVPSIEERDKLRQGLGVEPDTLVVLTVADNQERKNLSRSLEIFADYARDRKAMYWLLTRPRSVMGWKLEDYALSLGILDKMVIWERGISFKQLWSLFAAADIFLLTSKAEGLAMPVLEAMACRLPVVGTRCAAIEEHLSDGRGLMIEPDYVMVDPFGNGNRYLAGKEDGVYKLRLWRDGMTDQDQISMLNRAQQYVAGRSWDAAGDVLIKAIEQAQAAKEPIKTNDYGGPAILPETQPEMAMA